MPLETNSLVLENVIESLSKKSQINDRENLLDAYSKQIKNLAKASVKHILIQYRFGYVEDCDIPTYIKLLKDHDINTDKLEYLFKRDDSFTKRKPVHSSFHTSILNTLNLMMVTIKQIRDEYESFEAKPFDPIGTERPTSDYDLCQAYDLCIILRENFISGFGSLPYHAELFKEHVSNAVKNPELKILAALRRSVECIIFDCLPQEIAPIYLDAIEGPSLSTLGGKGREDDILIINFVAGEKDNQDEHLANNKAL